MADKSIISNNKSRCLTKGKKLSIEVIRHNSVNMHYHEFVELVYVLNGEGTHIINGMRQELHRGDILIIDQKVCHGYSTNAPITLFNCMFTPDFISEMLKNGENFISLAYRYYTDDTVEEPETPNGCLHIETGDNPEFRNLVEMAIEEFNNQKAGYMVCISSILNNLLVKIFRECKLKKKAEGTKTDIVNTILECAAIPNVKLDVAYLSQKLFFSQSYLSKIFKEQMGQSLAKYLLNLRLDKVAKLLLFSDMSIDCIMREVGYSDRTHFNKVFLTKFGVTPNDYRKNKNRNI